MRIKLDENLPNRLVGVLRALGHDTDTVVDERLAGQDDGAVWQAAQAAERFLITQDLHFSDARRYGAGTHHGLLLVRLAQPSRDALYKRISVLFGTEGRRKLGGVRRIGVRSQGSGQATWAERSVIPGRKRAVTPAS